MAQPTLEGLILNAGTGGSSLACDTVGGKLWQAILVGYSTADGAATIVMPDTGLPIVPATGATFAATQSGTWTVAVTGTFWQATQPVSGTFWQATQPVSAAALPLPSGAATSALQGGGLPAALGAGGGLKVDGSGTALPVTGTITTVTTVSAVTAITNALPAGTNAIGKLAANSGVDIGDVDVTSQPARAATTDSITAKLATDTIQNGTTALTPKFANISCAASGDNAIIAAVGGKKLRILQIQIQGSGTAVSAYLSSKDNTGAKLYGDGTNKFVLDKTGATGPAGWSLSFSPVGWFETASGEALNLNLSAGQAVVGVVGYVEV